MLLEILSDIKRYVHRNFEESEVADALRFLEGAVLHNGSSPNDRMLRSALTASDNSLKSLEHYVAELAVDYRDVILAGEYTCEKGEYVRVQDLSQPFELDAV